MYMVIYCTQTKITICYSLSIGLKQKFDSAEEHNVESNFSNLKIWIFIRKNDTNCKIILACFSGA